MTVLHIDFETRSELDLRQVGLHRYARHPSTDVWCMAWAVDEAEPSLWTPAGHDDPAYARAHVEAGLPVKAHNAPFELEIWNEILVKRYGWPPLAPEQTYCTMAQAYAMGLPGALEDAALALGLHMLKDTEGRALMLKFAAPWRTNPTVWMDQNPGFTVNGNKMTGAEGLKRLYEYCRQDVRVERELDKRLMPLSATERRVWLLDYKINQRGVQLDMPSVRAAVTLAEKVKDECNAKLATVTGGAVQAVTAVAALKDWMASRGLRVDGLAKQDVVDLLDGDVDLDPAVRSALTLRSEAGKASTAKFDVMVNRAGEDGRLRQMYQYHGAATGRWAGRAVQTHNLPRDMPPAETVETVLRLVREGRHDTIDAIFGPPLTLISRCLRSFFVAPPGKKLIAGDWANVESRGAAWFAGEHWKIEAFRRQDDKTGPDVYKIGASKLLGIAIEEVTKAQRQSHGKVPDLAFQYQGGVGSGKTMGKTYGVKATDEEWNARKLAWRAAHPAITAIWPALQRAAICAVQHPGETYECGMPGRQAKFKTVGSFLWCLLPSGRTLCYAYPRILEGEYGPQFTYMAVPGADKTKVIYDPKNASNWARVSAYGGSFLNNVIQAICRDFLAHGLLALDDKGAAIVLHTHDSIAAEVAVEKAEGARRAMEQTMRTLPPWAAGFPLFVECDVEDRFRG